MSIESRRMIWRATATHLLESVRKRQFCGSTTAVIKRVVSLASKKTDSYDPQPLRKPRMVVSVGPGTSYV